jgi:hypothetical protein
MLRDRAHFTTVKFAVSTWLAVPPIVSLGAPRFLTPDQPQVFLDYAAVQQTTSLFQQMHTPQKRGTVLTPDTAHGETMIQARSAPMWIASEQQYRMIYVSVYQGQWTPMLATSSDGIHWTRPNLGRTPPNRILFNDSSGSWSYAENVIYDENEPDANRRYKALLGTTNRKPGVSATGTTFTPLAGSTLTSGDESQLVQDPGHSRYIASLKTFATTGRAVGVSTSGNFTNWSAVQTVFSTNSADQTNARTVIKNRITNPNLMPLAFVDPEPAAGYVPAPGTLSTWACDVYNMAIFPYADGYVGMPAVFYRTGLDAAGTNTDGFHEIQLAFSRDLVNWQRLGNRSAFLSGSSIESGRLGLFDRTQLLPTSTPVEHGDELWFYYSGLKWRDNPYAYHADKSPRPQSEWTSAELADYNEGSGAVCLAALRKDGYFSLDAGASTGTMLTVPVTFGSDRLFLNLNAGTTGWAKVEVLNSQGQVIPGYTSSDATPITGDGVRIPVSWKSGALDQLAGQTVQFRISLQNASLYSYQVKTLPDATVLNVGANQSLGDLKLDMGNHTIRVGRNSQGLNVNADLAIQNLRVTGGGSNTIESTLPGNSIRVTSELFVEQSTSLIKTGRGLLIAGSVNAQGTLDLTDGNLAIDYSSVSPLATIQTQLASGYNAGSWTGVGIRSSSAASAASSGSKTALGFAEASAIGIQSLDGESIDSSTVVVRYTTYGDANLDLAVNTVDFNYLAGHFGVTGNAQWLDGDFNYDRAVNSVDFNLLMANYGRQMAPAPSFSVVPEPAAGGVVALVSVAIVGRKSRQKRANRLADRVAHQ